MGLSLVALERGLRAESAACLPTAPLRGRFLAGTVLRIALLIAGMTWSLAMFVEWGEVSPWTAPASLWYHWIFEHQLLSIVAILAALFTEDLWNAVGRWGSKSVGWAARASLLVAGFSWGVWVPSAAVSLGLGGFLNELFGVLGLPASWGSVQPAAIFGAALAFHWGFQHLLLGAFAIILSLRPSLGLAPLRWTLRGVAPGSDSGAPQSS